MKKIISYVAIASLAIVSCTKTDVDIAPVHSSIISIPIVMENEGIDKTDADVDTKSYLSDDGTNWSFVWEDEDQIGYYLYHDGEMTENYTAMVDKRPNSVAVNYPNDNFSAGDVLFSYFTQGDLDYGVDPTAMPTLIPTLQETTMDPEMYGYEEDYSFSLSLVRLDKTAASETLTSSDAIVGRSPVSRTLSFRIIGYNPDLLYCIGGDGSNLSVNAAGRATATVNFPAITDDDLISTNITKTQYTYKSTASVQVYVEGYQDQAVTIEIPVTTTYKCRSTLGLISSSYSASYAYSTSGTFNTTIIDYITEFGETKPYPVRNCMPVVSKQFTLTQSYITYPEDIQGNMTMYMLGSVIEFRIYSTNDDVAVGETLYGVEFIASGANCAGTGSYDITSEDLTPTGYDKNAVFSYDTCGKVVANGKSNYVSIYMVIAPGTYPATVNFITDQNVYTVNMSSKTFSRAIMKSLNVNLATAPASVTPFEDFTLTAEI